MNAARFVQIVKDASKTVWIALKELVSSKTEGVEMTPEDTVASCLTVVALACALIPHPYAKAAAGLIMAAVTGLKTTTKGTHFA